MISDYNSSNKEFREIQQKIKEKNSELFEISKDVKVKDDQIYNKFIEFNKNIITKSFIIEYCKNNLASISIPLKELRKDSKSEFGSDSIRMYISINCTNKKVIDNSTNCDDIEANILYDLFYIPPEMDSYMTIIDLYKKDIYDKTHILNFKINYKYDKDEYIISPKQEKDYNDQYNLICQLIGRQIVGNCIYQYKDFVNYRKDINTKSIFDSIRQLDFSNFIRVDFLKIFFDYSVFDLSESEKEIKDIIYNKIYDDYKYKNKIQND